MAALEGTQTKKQIPNLFDGGMQKAGRQAESQQDSSPAISQESAVLNENKKKKQGGAIQLLTGLGGSAETFGG